jgi:hypothetical protein
MEEFARDHRPAGRSLLGHTLLAAAIALAGGLVGWGLQHFRGADRAITVRGVAERIVEADVALWPLRLVAADNDLDVAQRRIASDRALVMAFLKRHGIDTTATELQSLTVTDTRAREYGGAPAPNRYVVNMTLMVRTREVGKIAAASQKVGELLAAGVAFSSGGEYGSSGPTYLFTKLNDLKPAMVAEATANARKAADEFAKQSGARLGGIRRGSQGVFEIQPRDPAPGVMEGTQVEKNLRVVTTIEYALR